MHPGDGNLDGLVRTGIAQYVIARPVVAYRKIASAGNDLIRYHSDYRNQYEVEMVFGTYQDPAWNQMKSGLSSFETMGWYKPFLPVYEIDHRAWRLYLIIRNCIDGVLAFAGIKERRGFLGVFRGDMLDVKAKIINSLGIVNDKHLGACIEMKRRWKGSLPRMQESFTSKEMVQNLIASLAFYCGACNYARCKPVFDKMVVNIEYINELVANSGEFEWRSPRGFF